jgi:hypothetical protein
LRERNAGVCYNDVYPSPFLEGCFEEGELVVVFGGVAVHEYYIGGGEFFGKGETVNVCYVSEGDFGTVFLRGC